MGTTELIQMLVLGLLALIVFIYEPSLTILAALYYVLPRNAGFVLAAAWFLMLVALAVLRPKRVGRFLASPRRPIMPPAMAGSVMPVAIAATGNPAPESPP